MTLKIRLVELKKATSLSYLIEIMTQKINFTMLKVHILSILIGLIWKQTFTVLKLKVGGND